MSASPRTAGQGYQSISGQPPPLKKGEDPQGGRGSVNHNPPRNIY